MEAVLPIATQRLKKFLFHTAQVRQANKGTSPRLRCFVAVVVVAMVLVVILVLLAFVVMVAIVLVCCRHHHYCKA